VGELVARQAERGALGGEEVIVDAGPGACASSSRAHRTRRARRPRARPFTATISQIDATKFVRPGLRPIATGCRSCSRRARAGILDLRRHRAVDPELHDAAHRVSVSVDAAIRGKGDMSSAEPSRFERRLRFAIPVRVHGYRWGNRLSSTIKRTTDTRDLAATLVHEVNHRPFRTVSEERLDLAPGRRVLDAAAGRGTASTSSRPEWAPKGS